MTTLATQTNPGKTYQPPREPYFKWRENEGSYTVQVYLPGVTKENVKVNAENRQLLIQAHREDVHPQTWKPLHSETWSGDYELRLDIQADVNLEQIQAEMKDGVLNLRLPVREEAKPRAIQIQ